MKKLNLLVLPLMAISFLTNCGGGGDPTPTEDVEFTTQSEVTLDRDNKKAIISLNWKPSDHSIECSDFTFTLNNQSDITSNITLGELGSRPLKVTIDFAKALEANDKGDLKFKYNDKTAKKEGEGKVTGINIKLHENPPTPGTYTISMETEGVTITPEELPTDKVYEGTIEVTAANKILNGLTSVILQDDSNTDITTHCTYDPEQDNKSASLEIPLKYLTNDIEVTVALADEPEPPVTTYHISMATTGADINSKDLPTDDDYEGTINVTANKKILNGISSIKLEGGTPITSYEYSQSTDCKSAQLTLYAPFTDNIEVAVNLIDEPEAKGTIKWTNYDSSLLVDAYQLPVGVTATYEGPTPIQPKDATHVHRFTGWNPDPTKNPVTTGDNVFNAVYDDVPITDAGAEFKIVIPATNADKTFTFTCNGSKKLTVDWGDTTVDNNNSHTYSESGTYVVSIYREDITNVNVTDSTSKSYIKEIDFKDKITSLADGAFSSCANLTSVKISKNITSLDANSFSECSALSTIVVASGNSKYDSRDNCNAIIEKDTNTLIKGCKSSSIPNTVTAVGDNAFKNCSGLGSMGIPDSVKTIGNYAFSDCTSMTAVSFIDSSLISIGDYAFSGCSKLTFFSVPDKVTSIGDYAFSDCTSLSNIDIPDSIISVGTKAFNNCALTYTTDTENKCKYLAGKNGNQYLLLIENTYDNITTTVINNSCKVICGSAFRSCSKLTTINIPDSVTSIGNSAFYDCSQLSTINISNSSSLVTIGNGAFSHCIQLGAINIPKNVTSIGDSAFEFCSWLSTVTISDSSSLVTIGNEAFRSCNKLTTINIPDSVTSIGDSAFADCSQLSTINISNSSSLVAVDNYAFNDCERLTTINIPDSVTSIGYYAFNGCSQLSTINISNSSLLSSIGGHAFNNCYKLTSINIPDGVTSIGDSAFKSCSQLSTINISNSSSLATIGNEAFRSCSKLTTINIPDSVTSIGDSAFNGYGCSSQLSTINISNSSSLATIGNEAFSHCALLSSINIPDSVTSIGDLCFLNCSILETVDLTAFVVENPNSIPSLGLLAFYGCNALTSLKVANANMAEIFKKKAGWSAYADKIVVA